MDEIQELLKIFYNFFVGGRNKPKPSTLENQPKYYKNKYYQPGVYRQHLTVDINDQIKGGGNTSDSSQKGKRVGNTKINESFIEEAPSLDEEEKNEEDQFERDQDADAMMMFNKELQGNDEDGDHE